MSAPNACLNCGAALSGPYCASCGQRAVDRDLSMREFLEDTTQELAHWEGKVPQSLKTLFLEPGRLTLDFLAGRRVRWLPPLRLYLICSLAYFLSSALAESITHRAARELDAMFTTNAEGSRTLTPEARAEIARGLPSRLFGLEKMERAIVNNTQFSRAVDTMYSKAMFVLMPFFALLTSVAWRRKMPRYPAHLYLALHLHAAWYGAFAITELATIPFSSNVVAGITGTVGLVYAAVYGLLALHRVFGDSWLVTIGKTAAVTAAYFVALFATSIVVLSYAVASI